MILAAVPFLGWLISLVVTLWALAATVVAVRQALDYDDTAKAVIVCVLAMAVFWVVMWLLGPGHMFAWY
jgi:hypothetical protein